MLLAAAVISRRVKRRRHPQVCITSPTGQSFLPASWTTAIGCIAAINLPFCREFPMIWAPIAVMLSAPAFLPFLRPALELGPMSVRP